MSNNFTAKAENALNRAVILAEELGHTYIGTEHILLALAEDSYPFPDYIKEILDENMEVDPVKLNQELNRLQPYVNV